VENKRPRRADAMAIPAIERAPTRGKLLSDQSTSRMMGGI